ncbi:MAG: cupin domain-containing protein [Cyclobacteriaceae bacterium]
MTKKYGSCCLNLPKHAKPHPEGGFFSETYRSPNKMKPEWTTHPRNISTAIYFMLTAGNFSAFHRIKSDEIWHHYIGGTAEIHVIHTNGEYELIRLGKRLDEGEVPQAVVPAGSWFASVVKSGEDFVLTGCTVAPGFDFADFEMASRQELLSQFPRYADIIHQLTR